MSPPPSAFIASVAAPPWVDASASASARGPAHPLPPKPAAIAHLTVDSSSVAVIDQEWQALQEYDANRREEHAQRERASAAGDGEAEEGRFLPTSDRRTLLSFSTQQRERMRYLHNVLEETLNYSDQVSRKVFADTMWCEDHPGQSRLPSTFTFEGTGGYSAEAIHYLLAHRVNAVESRIREESSPDMRIRLSGPPSECEHRAPTPAHPPRQVTDSRERVSEVLVTFAILNSVRTRMESVWREATLPMSAMPAYLRDRWRSITDNLAPNERHLITEVLRTDQFGSGLPEGDQVPPEQAMYDFTRDCDEAAQLLHDEELALAMVVDDHYGNDLRVPHWHAAEQAGEDGPSQRHRIQSFRPASEQPFALRDSQYFAYDRSRQLNARFPVAEPIPPVGHFTRATLNGVERGADGHWYRRAATGSFNGSVSYDSTHLNGMQQRPLGIHPNVLVVPHAGGFADLRQDCAYRLQDARLAEAASSTRMHNASCGIMQESRSRPAPPPWPPAPPMSAARTSAMIERRAMEVYELNGSNYVTLWNGGVCYLGKFGKTPTPANTTMVPTLVQSRHGKGKTWHRVTTQRLALLSMLPSEYAFSQSFLEKLLADASALLCPNNNTRGLMLAFEFLVGFPDAAACEPVIHAGDCVKPAQAHCRSIVSLPQRGQRTLADSVCHRRPSCVIPFPAVIVP